MARSCIVVLLAHWTVGILAAETKETKAGTSQPSIAMMPVRTAQFRAEPVAAGATPAHAIVLLMVVRACEAGGDVFLHHSSAVNGYESL